MREPGGNAPRPLTLHGPQAVFSFGPVWVVLAVWVPMGQGRGFALPLLMRLYTGAKRGGRAAAPSRPTTGKRRQVADAAHAAQDRRTKLELLREQVGIAAGWAPGRWFYLTVDSSYAGRMLLEHRPPNMEVVSRLRLDTALWAPAPNRRPGPPGRPRRRGPRLLTPQQVARLSALARPDGGDPRPDRGDGGAHPARALVRRAARPAVQLVLVRDPTGKRRDEAFICPNAEAEARFILEAHAYHWCVEVQAHDAKQFLGLADPQGQTPHAVQQTAPFAFVVYDLVVLWFVQHALAAPSPA